MNIAPPILWQLDVAGYKNNIILIEHDDEDDQLNNIISFIEGVIVVMSNHADGLASRIHSFNHARVVAKSTSSITDLYRILKSLKDTGGLISAVIIDGIDNFDVEKGKRVRGSLIKANISMCVSPTLLRGCNVIITSTNTEYTIEEIADKTIQLRK